MSDDPFDDVIYFIIVLILLLSMTACEPDYTAAKKCAQACHEILGAEFEAYSVKDGCQCGEKLRDPCENGGS